MGGGGNTFANLVGHALLRQPRDTATSPAAPAAYAIIPAKLAQSKPILPLAPVPLSARGRSPQQGAKTVAGQLAAERQDRRNNVICIPNAGRSQKVRQFQGGASDDPLAMTNPSVAATLPMA